jgi:hypothetical protein
MRVIIVVLGALTTLGLAAFAVVASQRAIAPGTSNVLTAHVAPAPTSAPVRRSPVTQVAEAQNGRATDASPVAPAPIALAAPAPAAVAAPATAPAAVAPMRVAQNTGANPPSPAPAAKPNPTPAPPAPAPAAATAIPKCDKPDAIGLARIVEIDTTGGPAFGTEHFKQYDFLRDKEVVLTFDDGPWPGNTPAVLRALIDNCIKATFFEIGKHATWHPEISKEVAAAGMTVGSHTWGHKDLAHNPYAKDIEQAKNEIEMGVSAVNM